MVKTAPMDDDVHTRLKDAQTILRKNYGIQKSISDIMSYIVESPKDIARKIAKLRLKEHQNAISNNDMIDENDHSEQDNDNESKSFGIELVEKDDVKT